MEAVNKERDDCARLSSNPARLAFLGRWFGALGVVVSCVHVCKYARLSVCLSVRMRCCGIRVGGGSSLAPRQGNQKTEQRPAWMETMK